MPSKARKFGHITYDGRKGFRGRNRKDAKMEAWIRDGCACRMCGRIVHTSDSRLDHMTPIYMGGTHNMENLQTLCIPCHASKTAEERRGG